MCSIASEFIENSPEDQEKWKEMSEEKIKQDCETKAFRRLADRLKTAFPKLPIILLGDSLYASEPVMKICEEKGWDYLIRFKSGSIPSVAEEYDALRQNEMFGKGKESGRSGDAEFINAIQKVLRHLINLRKEFCVKMFNDPLIEYLGTWAAEINVYSIIFRICLAIVLTSLVGCERSSKRHSAGLRTFIIVAMASATSAMVDISIISNTQNGIPIISAASVVSVAMISGNSILFSSRNQIKGLTTSAGLWGCGIIGLSAGAGLYTISFISFVALLCCISQLPLVEKILKNRSNHFEVHLELKNTYNLQDFVTTIRKLGLKIDDIESNPAYLNSGLSVYSVSMTIRQRDIEKFKNHKDIIEALRSLDYIHHIEEMR
ncbi:MAG: MgtC/SapB family protein [Synergistaceae bacterium]|nr:MgtC/SapB family protein [Synergistaceae bacterium]